MSADTDRPTFATERLAALSDGVFAIALTLLVLDLKIPEGAGDQQKLAAALVSQVPNFVAWVVSFVLLARFWMVHHTVLAGLARCHAGTLVVNFVVLALVSLVPFAAGLIGTYEFDALAIALFSGVLGATGVAVGLFARHAARHVHLHRADHATDFRWHGAYYTVVVPAVAALSMLLIDLSVPAALAIWLAEPFVPWLGIVKPRR